MSRIEHSLAAAAEQLRAACPLDFAGVGIYCLPLSRVQAVYNPALPCGANFLAYTAPDLDRQLAHLIGPQWMGPGFCCVVKDDGRYDDSAVSRWLVRGIVAHEAAHWFDFRTGPGAGPAVAQLWQGHVARDHTALTYLAQTTTDWPEAQHQAPFYRAAIHVAHRMHAIERLDVGYCAIEQDYNPAWSAGAFARTLQDELAAWPAATSLQALLQTPAPAAFVDLWRQKLQAA